MALDRQSIEKRDFPIGRRGYDPEAVDAHLARIADAVEELKLASHQRTENVAASASEQVRAIVEAAEQSATEIQRQAVEEAREIRSEAADEVHAARSQATHEAREYVSKVSESTATMINRLDAMQSELGTLLETLRTGGNRLNADLQLLEGNLVEVRGAVLPNDLPDTESGQPPEGSSEVSSSASTATAPRTSAAMPSRTSTHTSPPGAAPIEGPAFTWPQADPEVAGEQGDSLFDAVAAEPEPPADDAGEDLDGARLIALNMALNGTSREETALYLSQNYRLADTEALLDEVYSSVQG